MIVVRLASGIFQFQAFMADVPDVAVTAVGGIRGEGQVDAVRLAVVDLGLAGVERPLLVTPCSDDLQVRSERLDAELEADLVIALAGRAVADRGRAFLARDLNELLRDQRTRHGSAEQIFVFIDSVRLDAGRDVFIAEFIRHIEDVKLVRTAVLRALLEVIELFFLADVDADADDVVVEVLLQPRDDRSRVKTA